MFIALRGPGLWARFGFSYPDCWLPCAFGLLSCILLTKVSWSITQVDWFSTRSLFCYRYLMIVWTNMYLANTGND